MSDDRPEVFVICSAAGFQRREARPFQLFRLDPSGESRPFRIVVIRTEAGAYLGYVNTCPHGGSWLNFGDGGFFTADRTRLKCGRHGATFDIETGMCVDGPCTDAGLEPIALAVIDGDVCLCGVALVEDDRLPNCDDDLEDTMEIMIHP